MKKLASYLLLLIYFPVSFNFFLPVAAYNLNLQYIIDELCENKSKPESNCNGKCYLGKQMKEQTGKSRESEDKPVLTNTYRLPHIPVIEAIKNISLPVQFSYISISQNTKDLFKDVHTPPPKIV